MGFHERNSIHWKELILFNIHLTQYYELIVADELKALFLRAINTH